MSELVPRAALVVCLLAACAAPPAATGARLTRGEAATPTPVATHSRAIRALVTPRPSKASRSRVVDPPRAGTLTDSTCYLATGSLTASGKVPHVGMAASNSYPFGTRLLVESIGVVTVEDRIGHGTSLDLFMDSASACDTFGRRLLLVERLR